MGTPSSIDASSSSGCGSPSAIPSRSGSSYRPIYSTRTRLRARRKVVMATPERLPIANHTRRSLGKIATRGVLYDMLNYQTEDMVRFGTDFIGGPHHAQRQNGRAPRP